MTSTSEPVPLPNQLGLALDAAFTQAISFAELQQWAEMRVAELATPPDYLLELLSFDGTLAALASMLGDIAESDLSATEQQALAGIADLRGIARFEPSPSPAKAAKALQQSPQLLQRFCQQFPFIALAPQQ